VTEPASQTAAQLCERIRHGEIDAHELFESYRSRALSDELGAFLWVSETPESFPTDRPLASVPIGIKDVFCVKDVPSTAGSRILSGYRPPYTATAVAKLFDAGATMLGKTNMDEFAMGSSNENSGYKPVYNPWDRTRVPGGSSGGSAAAVAGGLVPWAIGTDTGGSVRQPASLCGVVGLKPTYGAVSRYGLIAFASSFDQCGPVTRDVTDAALLYSNLLGRDPLDSTSLAHPYSGRLPTATSLEGLRIGVPRDLLSEGAESGVMSVFEDALGAAKSRGAQVSEVSLPHAGHGLSAYYVLAPAEASANLARYDGVRYGARTGADDLGQLYANTRSQGFGQEVKRRIMLGTYALSAGYYEAYYGRAQRVRTKIVEDFQSAFEQVDLIATPTSPTVAFKLGERTKDPVSMYLSDLFTAPMSLAGIPAISIPAGLSGGLPVGLQLAGPAFSENLILDAGFALEAELSFATMDLV
jgi:aspartyl-tRNA(Asn)/glutamyl-tRNA(Gln) amidotransferase subunit A